MNKKIRSGAVAKNPIYAGGRRQREEQMAGGGTYARQCRIMAQIPVAEFIDRATTLVTTKSMEL